ncbi:LOW QUALITY PROTEIN: hypothetical protein PHMEG_00023849 [Phytophthora megakarya]|uniref:Reverse transcriptase RNase H-like domain-containing protein n=1 Tax=Phytophthora megakarya TaxID=4795 RepID=A0A225VFD5_9STRA|nr:LOW QUALITY PROTEIN: hypothetical protein PHMEG_00023849 [Phytophthora megakarya]
MQMQHAKLYPVRFCGRVRKDAEMNYHSAKKEVLALLLLLKVCYTQLAGETLYANTRFSTLGWVHISKSLFGRGVQFAVPLSPWQLEVQLIPETDCALSLVAPPIKGSPTTRLDPNLLYAQLPHDYEGFVVSFDSSTKTAKNGGYAWKLRAWQIAIAASAYLDQTTANMAGYSDMNDGALEHDAEGLVMVGDSRPTIQQSLRVLACRESWKWADNFALSSDSVLYYTGVSTRKVDENSPDMS